MQKSVLSIIFERKNIPVQGGGIWYKIRLLVGILYTMQQVLGTASAVARRCHCAQQLQDVFSSLTADDEKGIISFLTEIFSGLAQHCARLCKVVQPSQVNKLQNKPAMYRI